MASPAKNRSAWKPDTIVEPFANVSGSTSVACWLPEPTAEDGHLGNPSLCQARVQAVKIPRVSLNTLDLQYGIAVVAAGRKAIAVDLTTGRSAVVGRASSRLLGVAIERPGVALASTTAERGLATFVPLAHVEAVLGRS